MNHPIQPLELDGNVKRFKRNHIVQFLLDQPGGADMNQLVALNFSKEDHQQFAQLIGYSLSGYGDLSYVDDYAYGVAERVLAGELESQARIAYLENELSQLRNALREPMANLFGRHPDDLRNNG
jgi:hypothetical protein